MCPCNFVTPMSNYLLRRREMKLEVENSENIFESSLRHFQRLVYFPNLVLLVVCKTNHETCKIKVWKKIRKILWSSRLEFLSFNSGIQKAFWIKEGTFRLAFIQKRRPVNIPSPRFDIYFRIPLLKVHFSTLKLPIRVSKLQGHTWTVLTVMFVTPVTTIKLTQTCFIVELILMVDAFVDEWSSSKVRFYFNFWLLE